MTTKYYVELKRTVYFGSEALAETLEEAENIVLTRAGGNPLDWEIVRSEEVPSDRHDSSDGARIEIM